MHLPVTSKVTVSNRVVRVNWIKPGKSWKMKFIVQNIFSIYRMKQQKEKSSGSRNGFSSYSLKTKDPI